MSKKSHFEIRVQTHFSAAHHLRGYPGDCATPHGHNWIVDVYIECDKLNELGIGIDFRDVKSVVKEVIGELDHGDLNLLPYFKDQNPSSENVAQYIYRKLATEINTAGLRMTKVCVRETDSCGASYWED